MKFTTNGTQNWIAYANKLAALNNFKLEKLNPAVVRQVAGIGTLHNEIEIDWSDNVVNQVDLVKKILVIITSSGDEKVTKITYPAIEVEKKVDAGKQYITTCDLLTLLKNHGIIPRFEYGNTISYQVYFWGDGKKYGTSTIAFNSYGSYQLQVNFTGEFTLVNGQDLRTSDNYFSVSSNFQSLLTLNGATVTYYFNPRHKLINGHGEENCYIETITTSCIERTQPNDPYQITVPLHCIHPRFTHGGKWTNELNKIDAGAGTYSIKVLFGTYNNGLLDNCAGSLSFWIKSPKTLETFNNKDFFGNLGDAACYILPDSFNGNQFKASCFFNSSTMETINALNINKTDRVLMKVYTQPVDKYGKKAEGQCRSFYLTNPTKTDNVWSYTATLSFPLKTTNLEKYQWYASGNFAVRVAKESYLPSQNFVFTNSARYYRTNAMTHLGFLAVEATDTTGLTDDNARAKDVLYLVTSGFTDMQNQMPYPQPLFANNSETVNNIKKWTLRTNCNGMLINSSAPIALPEMTSVSISFINYQQWYNSISQRLAAIQSLQNNSGIVSSWSSFLSQIADTPIKIISTSDSYFYQPAAVHLKYWIINPQDYTGYCFVTPSTGDQKVVFAHYVYSGQFAVISGPQVTNCNVIMSK